MRYFTTILFRLMVACPLLAGAFVTAGVAQAAISVEDGAGRTISLAQPARRIVSLSPHTTENLFAAGAGAYIVGVVSYSDFPAAAAKIRRVGDANNLDLEAIVALRPDLVVAWDSGNSRGQIEKLQQLGLVVYASEPRRIDDVPVDIEALGQLAGTEPAARQAAATFRAAYARLRNQYTERRSVSVFFEIWNRPLMTVNGSHLISDVISLCGGKNVFAEVSALASEISTEAVMVADPQVIIVSSAGERRAPWLDEWRRMPQLQAVKKGRLFAVRPDLITRPTSRILEAARMICEQLDQARRTLPNPAGLNIP